MTRRGAWVILGLLLLLARPAWALEVEEVIWGFDGRVVPGRVTPVSVLLLNETEQPFDGRLTLQKTSGIGGRVGAELVQPLFLSPHERRWAQFYVVVQHEREEWVLGWGRGGRHSHELPQPRLGPRARVVLAPRSGLAPRSSDLRLFPEAIFPPTVAALDALDSVLLDHEPDWEPVRRQALLDWVHRGGVLHLLRGRTGDHPPLGAELAPLASPLERHRVGAGLVVRHDAPVEEMTAARLAEAGFPAPAEPQGAGSGNSRPDLETHFFQHLNRQTRPRHNWPLIYGLVVLYLLMIGPANFIVGRKVRDYRVSILFLLLIVGSFAAVFFLVGRRGYGESSTVHTVSYARPVGGGRYDVTHWSNVFVTGSGAYLLTHAGTHNIYSTAHEHESVRGMVENGRDGKYLVEMPLYSSRSLVYRGVLEGDPMALEVEEFDTSGGQLRLRLATGPGFPADVIDAWALHEGQAYRLAVVSGAVRTTGESRRVADMLQPQSIMQEIYSSNRFGFGWDDDEEEDEPEPERFRPLLRPLMADALGILDGAAPPARPDTPDRVQLFLFARSPETFALENPYTGREVGYTLYHVDLFRPGS